MAIETGAARADRPRPILLIALAVLVLFYVASRMFSGPPAPTTVPTTPARGQAAANGTIDPQDLDVRIEALSRPAPPLEAGDRNPFRFGARPTAAPPPGVSRPAPPSSPVDNPPVGPPSPPVDLGPPPIGNTIKFIGYAETENGKIGAFSVWDPQTRECRGVPSPGREGEVIEGRYRVVRIGIESATLEYLDGKGRQTLPLNGQACVGK